MQARLKEGVKVMGVMACPQRAEARHGRPIPAPYGQGTECKMATCSECLEECWVQTAAIPVVLAGKPIVCKTCVAKEIAASNSAVTLDEILDRVYKPFGNV